MNSNRIAAVVAAILLYAVGMWIYVIITIVGLIIFLIGVLGIIGSRMPLQHVATCGVVINAPPDAVFDVVSDVPGHAKWAEGVGVVNPMPDKDGKKVNQMVIGRKKFTLVSTHVEKPTRFTMTMDDNEQFFWGDWTYRLAGEGNGKTKVTLTETGNVNSAIFRAMMKIFGEHMYLKKNLTALAKKFGNAAPVVTIEK